MSSQRRGRSGFTRLELICVVAVIAVLASILFPVFAATRERARSFACRMHLHQLGIALHLYARDYDGRFPPAENDLTALAAAYGQSVQAFRCPSDAGVGSSGFPAGGPPPAGTAAALAQVRSLTSYAYAPPRPATDSMSVPLILETEFRHQGRANVLLRSGEVTGLEAFQWIPRTRRPPARVPGRPGVETPFLPGPAGATPGPGDPGMLDPGALGGFGDPGATPGPGDPGMLGPGAPGGFGDPGAPGFPLPGPTP
ncbi:MAG: DUF1559 domain-containing protein [Armatimonadetes bacterium]|nr:DUF1559 domain-containing protein [Armatimonadota bacterium]